MSIRGISLNLDIGRRIRELRNREDLTQEKLGEFIGMSRQGISNLELGKGVVGPDIAFQLYTRFHVTPTELLLGYKERGDLVELFRDCDEEEMEHLKRVIVFEREEYRRLRDKS